MFIVLIGANDAELHRSGLLCFCVTGKTCRPDGANGFLPRFPINMPRLRRSAPIGINAKQRRAGSPFDPFDFAQGRLCRPSQARHTPSDWRTRMPIRLSLRAGSNLRSASRNTRRAKQPPDHPSPRLRRGRQSGAATGSLARQMAEPTSLQRH